MEKFLQRALGIILGAIIAIILSSAIPASAQQVCPYWHEPPCPPSPPAAITQEEKDQFSRDAEKMGRAAKYFTLIAATAKSFGSDMVSNLIAQAAAAAALGSAWAQVYFEAAANDPEDDNYQLAYDAPWYSAGQLGFEYCAGEGIVPAYCNAFIDTITRVQRHGEGAYVSLNRAGKCVQVGSWDCARWQADLAKWYLRQMGDASLDAGYYLWVLRDNASDIYSPDCNCWLSQALNQAAWDFSGAGEYLRNRY